MPAIPRDRVSGEEDAWESEAEVEAGAELAPAKRRGLGARVRDAVTPDWARPMDLGPNMKIRTRRGFRAAIIEVKPGLFVVAEVPETSFEFGFGPMLLAPALIKTLGRAFQRRGSAGGAAHQHRPGLSADARETVKQLAGPTEDEGETEGLARWLDGDIAEEIGCPACIPKNRRQP